jgi:hypothetical protein
MVDHGLAGSVPSRGEGDLRGSGSPAPSFTPPSQCRHAGGRRLTTSPSSGASTQDPWRSASLETLIGNDRFWAVVDVAAGTMWLAPLCGGVLSELSGGLQARGQEGAASEAHVPQADRPAERARAVLHETRCVTVAVPPLGVTRMGKAAEARASRRSGRPGPVSHSPGVVMITVASVVVTEQPVKSGTTASADTKAPGS